MPKNSFGQIVVDAITPANVLAERVRQINELGHTPESDDEKGVDQLLVFALQYLERGEVLKGAALIQAARQSYERRELTFAERLFVNPMQADIQNFMEICEQEVRKYPSLPDDKVRDLRIRLMVEELLGSTKPGPVGGFGSPDYTLIKNKSDELVQSLLDGNLVGIADGIADVLYVVIGTAVAYGINIQEVFNEVHRSNMSKAVWDSVAKEWVVMRDEGGKVIKPPTFSEANIGPIILRQIEAGRTIEARG